MFEGMVRTNQYVGLDHTIGEIWVDYTTAEFSFTGVIRVIRRFLLSIVHAGQLPEQSR